MTDEKEHIASNSTYFKVATVLLLLTALNITLATLSHAKWVAALIFLIAISQAWIALTWFMHLKWDSRLLRVLVFGVFLFYLVILAITFLDYKFR